MRRAIHTSTTVFKSKQLFKRRKRCKQSWQAGLGLRPNSGVVVSVRSHVSRERDVSSETGLIHGGTWLLRCCVNERSQATVQPVAL